MKVVVGEVTREVYDMMDTALMGQAFVGDKVWVDDQDGTWGFEGKTNPAAAKSTECEVIVLGNGAPPPGVL